MTERGNLFRSTATFAVLAVSATLGAGPAAAATVVRTSAPAALSAPRVGVELPAFGPGTGVSVFVDVAKQASPWTSTSRLAIDRLGYVRSLAPAQTAESLLYSNEAHPGGDFTLLYRGKGELDVTGATVVSRSDGRMVVRVAASSPRVSLILRSTDPADYVRDVHFVRPGFERSYAFAPFDPQFIAALNGVALVRFAQWMRAQTFASSAVSLLRPTTGAYTQAGVRGVAPEYAVALANALGADPWLTVPVGATDGDAYAIADAVHRGLDSRLHAAFEYGDRVWQTGTPDNAWAVMAAANVRLPGSAHTASLEWYALRSTRLFAVEQRAFGADGGRIVRVLSGPLANAQDLRTTLTFAAAASRSDAFFVSEQPAENDALALLASSHLRLLRVASLGAARAYLTAHPAERVIPNAALRFVPTPASEEWTEKERQARPPRVAPTPAKPNATPERPVAGAVLHGEVGDPLGTVDLTREGALDWVRWSGPSETSRKATESEQIVLERYGREGLRSFPSSFAKYVWHDGSAGAAARGGLAVSGAGRGFALSAPADGTLRTLRVYVEEVAGLGRFTASLSDHGAQQFVDESLDAGKSPASSVFTVTYRASHPGQKLLVTFAASRVDGAGSRSVLEGATLQETERPPVRAASDETTFHNDNARTGWNPYESALTTQNVATSSFGNLATINVDGVVLAQPLYLSQVTISGQGTHNVLLVATEHNTLYEFDADTYQLLNSRNFGTSQSSNHVGCSDILPEYGITSTPVVDRSTNRIYVVSATEPTTNNFQDTIFAVDIGTLADQTTPVPLTASVLMSNGGTINFSPQYQQSRTSLAFNNGYLYVGIGSRCDNDSGGIVGWMLKYDSGLNQVASFATAEDTTGYLLDSIWMGGYASAIDANGNVVSVTGNGAFDAQNGGHDFGESIIKLDANLTGVQSYFTPTNWSQLNGGDTDFGSGGVMLLPPQQSSTPNLAVAMGKDSHLYMVSEDNLGGLGGYLQLIQAGGSGVWGGPAYFSGSKGQYVYYQTGGSVLKAYKIKTNKKNVTLLKLKSQGTSSAGYGGSSPVVSSNGQNPGSGIVWLVHRDSTLTLEAYDASNVGRLLFSGAAGSWSNPENNGFVTPLVANGKVYVPAQGTVTVFGLH